MHWRSRFVAVVAPALALSGSLLATGASRAGGTTTPICDGPCPPAPFTIQTQTYGFTGATQTFTVPEGITSIGVQLTGGQGGDGAGCTIQDEEFCGAAGTGGFAAIVDGELAVTPGETLTIVTGGAGGDATAADDTEGTPSVGGAGKAGSDTATAVAATRV
jgi:hypothetical protein